MKKSRFLLGVAFLAIYVIGATGFSVLCVYLFLAGSSYFFYDEIVFFSLPKWGYFLSLFSPLFFLIQSKKFQDKILKKIS